MKKLKLFVILGILGMVLSLGSNAFAKEDPVEDGHHMAGIH